MFYRGVVEDNNHPEKNGMVRVRIFGIHSEKSTGFDAVSTSDLPWAEVAGGTEFGLVSGVGISSVLRKGTMVWVFFKEDDFNYPVVFATAKGNNSSADPYGSGTFCDPDGVYPKRMGPDIHPSAQGAYTSLATLETASGHLIELDDSDGNERIKITHKTGSFVFIDKDGNIFVNSVKNIEYTIAENAKWTIGGKLDILTGDNTNINSGGKLGITSSGTTDINSGGNLKAQAPKIDLN